MPSSVLNSDDGVISGTSGLKSSGGDDGVLVFQSKGTETARINTDKQIVAAAGTASLPVLTTTGDVNTGIYFPAADNIGFATNGVIRGRWTTDGLCFGTDTAAANALDDYEEGVWTPVAGGDSTFGSATYSVQVGRYTKTGNRVFFMLYISYSGGTGSGNLIVSGLPFTANSVTNNLPVLSVGLSNLTLPANSICWAYVQSATNYIILSSYAVGGSAAASVTYDASAAILLAGHYEV